MAEELERARQGVADDRRAQVPDVHLLGDVRARVVEDDGRAVDALDAEAIVAEQHGDGGAEPRRGQREVDEPRAGDLRRLAEIAGVERGDDRLRRLARILSHALRQAHRDVRLIVAEAGVLRRPHQRVGVDELGPERPHDGVAYPCGEDVLGVGHGARIVAGRAARVKQGRREGSWRRRQVRLVLTIMNQQRIAANLAAVEAHFHAEAENEVTAALELYTDDIVWEAPALNGLDRAYSGKDAVVRNYRELWASMRDVKFTLLQRFATEDRVVDDSLVTFEVIRDGYWHFPVGSKIEMRLVHIFEMRDGKIARELVFDMGRPRRE